MRSPRCWTDLSNRHLEAERRHERFRKEEVLKCDGEWGVISNYLDFPVRLMIVPVDSSYSKRECCFHKSFGLGLPLFLLPRL